MAFFAFAFVAAWAAFVPAVALLNAGGAAAPAAGALVLLGAVSPGVVAIAMVAWREGVAGAAAWLRSLFHGRAGLWLYVFAALCIVTVKLATAVLLRMGTGSWPAFGQTAWPLMAGAVLVSMWVQAGEEIGWRGYALPRLAERFGLGPASLVLGVIWAAWHLPLFFAVAADTYQRPLAVYGLQVTALSVIMAWLYWRAGTLLPVMLFHATVNNVKGFVPSGVPPSGLLSLAATPVAWVTIGLLWLLALVLLWRMRGAVLRGAAEPASAFV